MNSTDIRGRETFIANRQEKLVIDHITNLGGKPEKRRAGIRPAWGNNRAHGWPTELASVTFAYAFCRGTALLSTASHTVLEPEPKSPFDFEICRILRAHGAGDAHHFRVLAIPAAENAAAVTAWRLELFTHYVDALTMTIKSTTREISLSDEHVQEEVRQLGEKAKEARVSNLNGINEE